MKAVYPGSFDPLSNGHLDIIRRAAKKCLMNYIFLFPIICLKKSTFTPEERVDMIKLVTKNLKKCLC
ncbi:MAG: adenylyltransferase/cytidyltransferase family protein [Clostridium sp.]|nr:MAG: adenylyltransferase/cytidyltransferase family protein [Clostridium sp.]